MPQLVTYALFAIYVATIIGIILVIIAGNRNPLKAIPWVLLLIFAPGVGLGFLLLLRTGPASQTVHLPTHLQTHHGLFAADPRTP